MELLESWFKEMRRARGSAFFETRDARHVVYRGFKISVDEAGYHICDTRYMDFYSPVRDNDMALFEEIGIIKGAAFLMYKRDGRRVVKLDKQIAEQEHLLATLASCTGSANDRKRSSLRTEIKRLKHGRSYLHSRQQQINKEFNFEAI